MTPFLGSVSIDCLSKHCVDRVHSYAGLHCVEVKGHSKSVGYEPGMKITPDIFQNTWNSVLVAGDWRLIQCNWGARSVEVEGGGVEGHTTSIAFRHLLPGVLEVKMS